MRGGDANMRLKEARKAAGFSTQEQLAKELDVPRSTLAKWEAGITQPRANTLTFLARTLGCTIDDLFSDETDRTA